jgi:hypothetical protein
MHDADDRWPPDCAEALFATLMDQGKDANLLCVERAHLDRQRDGS